MSVYHDSEGYSDGSSWFRESGDNPRANPIHDELDDFTRAYIEAALWSSTDYQTDEPLDKNYCLEDIRPQTLRLMIADCKKFQSDNIELLKGAEATGEMVFDFQRTGISDKRNPMLIRAGHDFWLTRAGHGCGFWDGDWPEPYGDKLTEASKKYAETPLIVCNGWLEIY